MLSWKKKTSPPVVSYFFAFASFTGCCKRSTRRTAMNLRDAASDRPLSQEQHHEADTRLHGRKLPLGRIVWFALVVLTLSVCMASLPDYFTELQTVCRLAVCSYGQLSPDTVVALQHFGLSVGSYATFMFALATVVALVVFGTGGLI